MHILTRRLLFLAYILFNIHLESNARLKQKERMSELVSLLIEILDAMP